MWRTPKREPRAKPQGGRLVSLLASRNLCLRLVDKDPPELVPELTTEHEQVGHQQQVAHRAVREAVQARASIDSAWPLTDALLEVDHGLLADAEETLSRTVKVSGQIDDR